jgi:hypothetical protein
MVNQSTTHARRRGERSAILLELVVAVGILGAAAIPLAYSFSHEQQLIRAYYYRAIAMEIVDGEMEVLVAGEWHSYREGEQPCQIRAESSANLPQGRFVLTRRDKSLHLEWVPEKNGMGGRVTRDVLLP